MKNDDSNVNNNINKFPGQGNFSPLSNSQTSPKDKERLNQALGKKGLPNIPNNKEQAKEEATKAAIGMAAELAAPGVGGKIASAVSETGPGKRIIKKTSENIGKSPFNLKGLFGKDNDEEAETEKDDIKKIFSYAKIIGVASAILFAIILVVVVVYIIISPLIYINNLIGEVKTGAEEFTERLGNFLTFRGWCTDSECAEKETNDFYKEIDNVYNQYKEDYNVELNVNLLTATLTYSDPFVTEDEVSIEELVSSDAIDFRKSKRKIYDLATQMVSYKEEIWSLDTSKYRKYLEDFFVRKFYFNNRQGADIDIQVKNVVDEIFDRGSFFEQLNQSNKSDSFVLNNTIVKVFDCNGRIVIDEVSLYEYLQGVLYIETNPKEDSLEYLKVIAISAKNYLYAVNGVTPDSMNGVLRINSCQINQKYCSVQEGCYNMNDGVDEEHNTIAPGYDGNYNYLLKPLDELDTLEKIKKAIDETLDEFIVYEDSFVLTKYYSNCDDKVCDSTTNILDKELALQMINSGQSYNDVLTYFYNGSIDNIEINSIGYPLDLKWNNITSAYGWRVHPIKGCCRHHSGTDIAAGADSNIYSIADGVIVTNTESSSYGYYVVVGHGEYNQETNYYEYYSLYAHQIRLSFVTIGQRVRAGERIGNVGSTGISTGNHLHIEVYKMENGSKVKSDPVEYFKGFELTGFVTGALYGSEEECMSNSGKGTCS